MTIMFCQNCHSISECKVESPQPSHRTIYFEDPYLNAYIRERTCERCGGIFKTYEIGEASFKALRQVVEMAVETGKFIEKTWANTKEEFLEIPRGEGQSEELLEFEKELEKENSILPPNVLLFNKNRDENNE